MNRIIVDHTAYNAWANNRMCSMLLKVEEPLLDQPVKSSYPSIRKTAMHIWDVEYLWLARLKGSSPDKFPSVTFKGNVEEMIRQWLAESVAFADYAKEQDILSLERIINYTNIKQVPYHNKVYEMIMHCMNHSTYHRGQLVTMLREVGFTDIMPTDLVEFYRERP